ncbi:hypothetical protein C8J31_101784 [Rhizobium sp. PP-CC-2G-626]|nr:hypothetical protein C8J31_101784 [Rhizobium sp. PP-CC-2G-626]
MNIINASHEVKLATLAEFKWWRLQNRFPATLLKEIIFRWRGANARIPYDISPWIAYPAPTWRKWMGDVSASKLERGLRHLVEIGFLKRERHKFAGSSICAFLQPTPAALTFMGRPEDIVRLRLKTPPAKPLAANENDGTSDGTLDGTVDGTVDGTDYTSFSSLPSSSSYSTKGKTVFQTGKGKGKVGEEKNKKKPPTPAAKPEPQPEAKPEPKAHVPDPVLSDDDAKFEAALAKINANKAKKAAKLYPELKGAHEKFVQHPATKYPKWPSWSDELKAKIYASYQEYVDNWYQGKAGKPYLDESISDDEWDATQVKLSSIQFDEAV